MGNGKDKAVKQHVVSAKGRVVFTIAKDVEDAEDKAYAVWVKHYNAALDGGGDGEDVLQSEV